MAEAKIPGGAIIIARKIIESEIMDKPPLYMKVWIYLLARAQHKEYKQLKRGQLITSVPEIQEACSWYVGARKVTPTEKEVRSVLDWMRGKSKSRKSHERSLNGVTNGAMISSSKVTHGLIVTIENYDVYQSLDNYERRTEKQIERRDEKSSNGAAGAEYKQECIKNEQDLNNNEPLPDSFDFDEELTEEQKLENEVKEYYETKLGRFSRPEDWRIIHKAINEEKFTRDELIQGISLAFSLNPDNINSFSYCLKVARTEREKRRKAQQKKKIVPINRRTDKPDELPMVLRPEFQQQHQNELSPEESEARIKAIKERIRQLNKKVPKVGEQ